MEMGETCNYKIKKYFMQPLIFGIHNNPYSPAASVIQLLGQGVIWVIVSAGLSLLPTERLHTHNALLGVRRKF